VQKLAFAIGETSIQRTLHPQDKLTKFFLVEVLPKAKASFCTPDALRDRSVPTDNAL
jgi:hypothetical protein